jgi:Holliday junction resolvasome RuvABC endonuclease subunit
MAIVMTNDPSMTGWGWAILDKSVVLESGCIKTEPEDKKRRIRKADDRIRRISLINKELIKVIKEHKPYALLSELPHGSQSANAAVMIGMVAGVMQAISDCFGIPVEWYSEGDAKKSVHGRVGNVTKLDTIVKMKEVYGVSWATGTLYKDEAVADALAIHHVACEQSPLVKFLEKRTDL